MGIGNVLKKGAGALGKGMQYQVGGLASAGSALTKAEIKMGKALLKKDEAGARFSNAYTGYQMKKAPMLAVAGVGGAYTVGSWQLGDQSGAFSGLSTRGAKLGEVSYGGMPGVFDADGVGTKTKAPTLGATGDMVFGLHNGRKG